MGFIDLIYRLCATLNRDRYRLYRPRNYAIYLNISESMMMLARARGWYEQHVFAALEAFLRPGMTFIDVGSNKGDFSLFAGHIVGPEGHVLAIEPEPNNCAWIRRSIAANKLNNVELCEVALSREDGRASLHLGAKSGFHSLVTSGPATIPVPTAKLDSLVQARGLRVDAIKIDVEGAELDALAGMTDILRRDRPMLWLEMHPQYGVDVDRVRAFLKDHDYLISERGNECQARPRIERPAISRE